ncbi:MAG TPA: hypothetical protein VFT86_05650, partial [Gaiellaceae bacterium]|nr:hypothetical protein [Gaiellaceae bacterium]
MAARIGTSRLFVTPLLLMAALAAGASALGADGSEQEQRLGPPRLVKTWIPGRALHDRLSVDALATDGRQVFVGGDFRLFGPPTGKFLLFSRAGQALASTASVAGPGDVEALVADGAGGWFLGGTFTYVGGVRCPRLAHVRRDESLDRRFCLSPNAEVLALARAGRTLYVGGGFTRIGSRRRARLAAVDVLTGKLRSWNPRVTGIPVPDTMVPVFPSVQALVASSSAVYVGGEFQRVGGAARKNIAALDPRTGRALRWQVRIGGADPGDRYIHAGVTTIALAGRRLYIGGNFGRIAGQVRHRTAAIRASNATLENWRPPFLGDTVSSIVPAGRRIFVAASSLSGDGPHGVFTLDRRTGRRTMRFRTSYWVNALALSGSTLYVGGEFDRVAGRARGNLASIDIAANRVTNWAPRVDGRVAALAPASGRVAVGGSFNAKAEAVRPHLAALEPETGHPLPFRVDLKGEEPSLDALAIAGRTLYVAGYFKGTAGAADDVAAVDLDEGRLASWKPEITFCRFGQGVLGELDGTLYVGAAEPELGEPPLQAVDRLSGGRKAWRPRPENRGEPVKALAAAGSRVYVAGDFTRVNGVRRRSLAAVDAETGRLLPWNPQPNGFDGSYSLSVLDGKLFVGGDFTRIGGARRDGAAAFDAATGQLLAWAPKLAPRGAGARAFASFGSAVFIAGNFRSVGGARRV